MLESPSASDICEVVGKSMLRSLTSEILFFFFSPLRLLVLLMSDGVRYGVVLGVVSGDDDFSAEEAILACDIFLDSFYPPLCAVGQEQEAVLWRKVGMNAQCPLSS